MYWRIKNLQTIHEINGESKKISTSFPRGMANSPDSRFLYINKVLYLYQFDLFAKDIAASKFLLAEVDSTKDTFGIFTVAFSNMQLTPNNKIYMSNSGGLDYLHSIENPNEKGQQLTLQEEVLSCQHIRHSVYPITNFRLGAAQEPL
ncbi:MAG: hypothetical protein IPL95_05315 [Saprospiraceae bacterium]|nr:hypothetical protein [Saprospiraceae bacterium]